MRLIDADALMESLYDELGEGEVLYRIPPDAVDSAPTVDAVEVVRCKDCSKRSDYIGCVAGVLYCTKLSRFMVDNDFCSYGERGSEHEA